MKKFKNILIILLIMMFVELDVVSAKNLVTYPEKIEITVNSVPKTTEINDTLNFNGYYVEVSPVYEFFDENDYYNILYEGNDSKLYWVKLSSNYEIISNIQIEMTAPLFGNAIYDNGYLYVIYGRNASFGSAGYTEVTVEVTKYDTTGSVIKNLELLGTETTSMTGSIGYGTWMPFSYGNPSNCSVAMRGNVLVVYFGRLMYNAHQSSYMLVVDTDTMEPKSNGIWPAFSTGFGTSHSFDQRVIVSSDNNIVTLDSGDANHRGFYLEKTEFVDTDAAYLHKFLPFHFREGSDATHGYNNLYSVMGNIIEISDGYIYVGASEKTLSLEYGDSNYNEPWNLFVQKYKSNFETQSSNQEIHMLEEEERVATGIKPEVNYGDLFLREGTTDYGVRWLTDFETDSTIDLVRAVKIDNDRTFVMYEKVPVLKVSGEAAKADVNNSAIYYMILDKDANIVQEPVRVFGVSMSKEINYIYDDGYIIWTTTNGKDQKLTINKLEIGNIEDAGDIPITGIEANIMGRYMMMGGSTSATITYYPENTNEEKMVTWSSSNDKVATVDKVGNIKSVGGGVATITATTSNNISTSFEVYVSEILLKEESVMLKPDATFKLELEKAFYRGDELSNRDVTWSSTDNSVVTVDNEGNLVAVGEGTATIKVVSNAYANLYDTCEITVANYIKGDMDKNGKLSFTDVMILLRTYLSVTDTTSESIEIGDMNSNGKLDFADVITLLRTYLGVV